MARIVLKRVRAWVASAVLHVLLVVILACPWSGWLADEGSRSAAVVLSHYIPAPVSEDRPDSKSAPCQHAPCIGEAPKPGSRSEPEAPQGEELEFLDDTGYALIPALRRAGGWVAIVSRSDRWQAMAFYRASDGANLGAGVEVARFPLRVVVQEPESYPEIQAWVANLRLAPEMFRAIAVFPPETQQRLHEAIEAEARRAGLAVGPRRAVVAVSSAEAIGIAVRSVALRPDARPQVGN